MKSSILLGKSKSKRSVNVNNKVHVELNTDSRVLPPHDTTAIVNTYEQYNKERDESNIFRLIFTINSVCTNILFNNITEVVYKEGSDDAIVLFDDGMYKKDGTSKIPENERSKYKYAINTTNLNREQAILDTEYSSDNINDEGKSFHYLCGLDIFDNHYLRSQSFKIVNSVPKSGDDLQVFNTIKDYSRLNNGEAIEEPKLTEPINADGGINKIKTHLYQIDDIMDFYDSVQNNIIDDGGWIGFVNKSKLFNDELNTKIKNNEMNKNFNRCLLNYKVCEQVDMYPDRTLFSFVPKVNEYRHNRLEYNWKTILTYPYKHDYLGNKLIFDPDDEINGIIVSSIKVGNGTMTYFKTPIKHNLNANDRITIYYKSLGDTTAQESDPDKGWRKIQQIEVNGTGNASLNDREHWFSVATVDIEDYFNDVSSINTNGANSELKYKFRICKNVGGIDSKYYFRLFKKLPNFMYSKQNVKDNSVIVDDEFINKILEYSKEKDSSFDFVLQKIAFAKNVYNDNIVQLIYTNDIDITKIKDNLGRPLSEIYLTIIKNNKGYEKWYNENIFADKDIEYSRAFGKVTNGLKLPIISSDDTMTDGYMEKYYNIRYSHNIDLNKAEIKDFKRATESELKESSTPLTESGVTINGDEDDNVFVGDLVEFVPINVEEIVIEEVYHRFNTAQREFQEWGAGHDRYYNYYYSDMLSDDYDLESGGSGDNGNFFVQKTQGNKNGDITYPGNICPEGYIYKPHYPIKVRAFSNMVEQGASNYIGVCKAEYDKDKNIVYSGTIDIVPNVQSINVISNTDEPTENEMIINNFSFKKFKVKNLSYMEVGDTLYFYFYKEGKKINNIEKKETKIVDISIDTVNEEKKYVITIDDALKVEKSNKFLLYRKNSEIPYCGYDLCDGSGRMLWRNAIKPSSVDTSNVLSNVPFTNGAFYINKNINFYLRRQDPFKEFDLINPNQTWDNSGVKNNVSTYDYITEENNEPC